MSGLDFLDPAYLWLLPLLILCWFLPARRGGLAPCLRAVTGALVILALARPVLWREDAGPAHHVLLLDASASARPGLGTDAASAAREWRRSLAEGDRPHLVQLGAPLAVGVDEEFETAARLGGSDLAAGLTAAGLAVPAGARGSITVVSDGLSTHAGWATAVQSLQERGLPVHAVALAPDRLDPRPVALTLAGLARVGQVARVAVDVVGAVESARVVLFEAGPAGAELAASEPFAVGAEGRRVALEFEPAEAGFLGLRAELEVLAGATGNSENDALSTTIAVQDPLRILYLRGPQGSGRQLEQLLGTGFELVRDERAEGAAPPALEAFDTAWIDDRPAVELTAAFQTELVDAVAQRGLGLFASGGRAAFGPGGFHEAPVGAVLPVESLQKEEKRDPSTTLAVIIDTSGSMGGERVQLAKEVSRLAIQRLLPHDKVGIVEFYGAKRWAAPIQPASNRIELNRALNRLDAGGGTVIMPALEEAFYGLQNVDTRYKHVLILTDGGVETGAFEPLLRSMADEGMNVSTVLIGPEAHSEFLVDIANWGKGRFYNVPNRFNLPELVLKQPTSTKLPAYRPGVHALRSRAAGGWFGDVEVGRAPALDGFVETRTRDGARVLLETETGGYPVLATWVYGLGRTTVMATEPVGAGTESWREWDDYGALLGRLVARTAGDGRLPFAVSVERCGAVCTVRAERLVREALRPTLTAESAPELEFIERSPGAFEARCVLDPAVELRCAIGIADAPARGALRAISPAAADVAPELNVDPARALDLERLSAVTGGRSMGGSEFAAEPPTAGGPARSTRPVELSTAAFWAALASFLFELFWRRRPRRISARAS